MKATKESLGSFIKEMSHYDPDNMEMGAKSVTDLVVSGQLNLDKDEKTSHEIRVAFMEQVDSENYNVHSHAIKCIAEIVQFLPLAEV